MGTSAYLLINPMATASASPPKASRTSVALSASVVPLTAQIAEEAVKLRQKFRLKGSQENWLAAAARRQAALTSDLRHLISFWACTFSGSQIEQEFSRLFLKRSEENDAESWRLQTRFFQNNVLTTRR